MDSISESAELDPTTQAIIETLQRRAVQFGDDFENSGSTVTIRCFDPGKHTNGDSHPSAVYTLGKYVMCPVCGYKKGQKLLAEMLGIGLLHGGLTVPTLAKAKNLPADFLQDWGWRTRRRRGRAAVAIPWYDARGPTQIAAAYHLRHYIAKSDGNGPRFTWDMPKNAKVSPYGTWRIPDWQAEAKELDIPLRLWIMESELDAVTGWLHGVPATAYGGAEFWKPEWVELYTAAETIYVLAESDSAGQRAARRIALDINSAVAERNVDVRVVVMASTSKDFNAVHQRVGGDTALFQQQLQELIAESIPADRLEAEDALALAEAQKANRERLASLAGPLLQDPALLYKAIRAIEHSGVVGEYKSVGIMHLALKSRVLKRPVNIEVNSPSSSGKTHLVVTVLGFEPPEAYYELTAGSERSLIYSEEPLEHRMLYFQEPEGLQQGIGAAVIKSLVWEGRLKYDVTIKEDGDYVVRHIEKHGPTGLILTTTRAVDEQIRNRMLRIELDSSVEQTRRILMAIARSMNGSKSAVDLAPWHAVSALVGDPADVEISFGEWEAEHLAVISLRLRRDFSHLLTLIQASAVLYQFQRARGPDGRIKANLADYSHVYELCADVFAAAQGEGVTEADRKMVEVVTKLSTPPGGKVGDYGVSQAEIRADTGLTKSPVSYRVTRLLGEGYLVNLETGRGKPHRLVPGAPLPDNASLPPPYMLAEYLNNAGMDYLVGSWVSPLTGQTFDFRNFGADHLGTVGTLERSSTNHDYDNPWNLLGTPSGPFEPFQDRSKTVPTLPQAQASHDRSTDPTVSKEKAKISDKHNPDGQTFKTICHCPTPTPDIRSNLPTCTGCGSNNFWCSTCVGCLLCRPLRTNDQTPDPWDVINDDIGI